MLDPAELRGKPASPYAEAMRIRSFFAMAAALSTLTACTSESAPSGDSSNDPPVTGPTYHADIAPILKRECVSCHHEGSVAPFVLGTYEQAAEVANAIKTATASRRMPPFKIDNSGDCNEFEYARWLSDDELAAIAEWADNGAPRGNPSDEPEVDLPPVAELAHVDAVADIGLDYTPLTGEADDVRCFVVDVGVQGKKYVTGYKVNPGDRRVVHHAVIYDLATADALAQVEALDAEDAHPGYPCFGGSGAQGGILVAWAPGMDVVRYPAGTGLPFQASNKVVIQMHYNTAGGVFPDRTTIDLELADTVPNPTEMRFLVDLNLALPPGQQKITTTYDVDPTNPGTFEPVLSPITMYGGLLHQHVLGRRIRVDRIRDNVSTCLMNIPSWDWNWQQMYFFADGTKDILPTDKLRVTCDFDTTSRNEMTTWGESTNNEMCVVGLYTTSLVQ